MLARILLVSLILAGCSKQADAPAATSGPSERLAFPFVPDPISNQLGSANVIIAIDLAKFELTRFGPMIPEGLECVRGLLGKVGIVVIASGDQSEGFVTGMPEDATIKCITDLAPLLGATTRPAGDAFQLVVGGDTYSMRWGKDGTTTIRDEAHPMKVSAPNARMRELVAQLPKDAEAWIVSGGFPKFKIKSSVAWIKSSKDSWHLVVTAEGTEPDVARPWVEGIIKGFKEGAGSKGITVEDSWFKVTSTPMTARLEGDIPSDLFTRPRQ